MKTNTTNFVLERENFKLHGTGQLWKQFPPEKIQPGESISFGSCSSTLISGTCASVTYRVRIDLDYVTMWFRWDNPFSKLLISKKALFEAPSRIRISAHEDLSETHKIDITESDIYRIQYVVKFDPELQPASSSGTVGTSLPANPLVHHAGGIEGEWIEVPAPNQNNGPVKKEAADPTKVKIVTSYGETEYHADWIPALKQSARSVLVTILNESPFTFTRKECSLIRGLWRAFPGESIAPNNLSMFGTGSHGIFGLRSGTIGSVTYSAKLKEGTSSGNTSNSNPKLNGEVILTFEWTNHLVWGIKNDVKITSSLITAGSSSPELLLDGPNSFLDAPVEILTESIDEAACEITFTISHAKTRDTSSSDQKLLVITTKKQQESNNNQENGTDDNGKQAARTKRLTKFFKQENGVTWNKTSDFLKFRCEHLNSKKDSISKMQMDLEYICHNLITRSRKQQEVSFFDSLFAKDELSLEEQADVIPPTTKTQVISTSTVCPITNLPLRSEKEKAYCYLCGRIVSIKALVPFAFPESFQSDLSSLKKPPPPIHVCCDDNSTLNTAKLVSDWKAKWLAGQNHPIQSVNSGVNQVKQQIQISINELKRFAATKDQQKMRESLTKIPQLFHQLDDLQMQLFALNEDSARSEQKVHNQLALLISEWKAEVFPEFQELQNSIT